MGFNLSGGMAAGQGADALESLLSRLFAEGQARIRNQQVQQGIDQEGQRLKMAADDRAAAQADLAKSRAIQNAGRIAGNLRIGQSVTPDTLATLTSGDLGDLVQHEDADLPSRAISGVAQAGTAAPIMGQLRMAQAGRPERDTFTGTADQLAAEQARQDRIAAQAEAQAERERVRKETADAKEAARVQALTDKKEMVDYVNANKPAPTPHARYQTVQGTDAAGRPVIIRTNVDTGDVQTLQVPEGVNFSKREQPATMDQTNLSIYGKRIEQAEPHLTQLEAGISQMNPLSYEAQTRLDYPSLQSKEMQQYMQSARNFINAVLRRESGAAISPTEFAEARKQYLPMPGDTAETLQQKKANRNLVFEQFRKGSGPAWGGSPQPAAARGPATGTTDFRKKYDY